MIVGILQAIATQSPLHLVWEGFWFFLGWHLCDAIFDYVKDKLRMRRIQKLYGR